MPRRLQKPPRKLNRPFSERAEPLITEAMRTPRRNRPAEPRLAQRRVNLTAATLQTIAATLRALVAKPTAKLREQALQLAQATETAVAAKLAEPVREQSGRPKQMFDVWGGDMELRSFTGAAATAEFLGVKPSTLSVRMSQGGGIGRFPRRDSNGNPCDLFVSRQKL